MHTATTNVEQRHDIGVVIPAYNAAATIRRAIDSVLAQTYPAREIIVVDDGSTDRTASVVSEYGGRVEYIYQDNAGPGSARNAGIRAARSDWIAFLDADDEWLPHKLACQSELLARHPDLVWVTGNYVRCRCTTGEKPSCSGVPTVQNGSDTEYVDDFFQLLRRDSWGCTDTLLIRRDVFGRVGPFHEHRFTEDLDMWVRIACRDRRIGLCRRPLAVYHVCTPGSLIDRFAARDAETIADFLSRTLHAAEQADCLAAYRPAAGYLLGRWLRAMLFHGYGHPSRTLLRRFGDLLPSRQRFAVRLACLCPQATRLICRSVAAVIRRCR